jgi:methionyl-tRNA formyltransferase
MARVVFMGTPEFAVPSLRALIEAPEHEVVGVITQPDRPVGRGQVLTPSPVKQLALEHGIPVFQPAKMKVPETAATFAAFAPDVAVVAAYGRILTPTLLAVPKHGCINVHASLLPRWRGAAPIAYAIWKGDAETGVGIMRMEEGLDTGPVYAEARLSIEGDDTTASLTPKLADLGARTLLQTLPKILDGKLAATPQAAAGITHAPPLAKTDGSLDLRYPAAELERQVRAMTPWPGARILLGGHPVAIGKARRVDAAGASGLVLRADKNGVVVACGHDALVLEEVQLPGKRMMPAAAWVVGRGIIAGASFDLAGS